MKTNDHIVRLGTKIELKKVSLPGKLINSAFYGQAINRGPWRIVAARAVVNNAGAANVQAHFVWVVSGNICLHSPGFNIPATQSWDLNCGTTSSNGFAAPLVAFVVTSALPDIWFVEPASFGIQIYGGDALTSVNVLEWWTEFRS